MDRQLPDEAATLFRGQPEEFIAARNALVEQLRSEDRKDDAAAVKAVRKPTLVVWALNQLAARDPKGVEALLDAGRELRAAQQAALSADGGAERMREATVARRNVIARLLTVASEALEESGHGGGTQGESIASALGTASVDQEAGERLASGTLEAVPAESGGFGDVFGLASVPDAPTGETPAEEEKPSLSELKKEVTRLGREQDKAATAARKHREAADALAHKLEDLRARLSDLEADHAEASARADESEVGVKRLERELSQASEELARVSKSK
jgi:hypothetical protein